MQFGEFARELFGLDFGVGFQTLVWSGEIMRDCSSKLETSCALRKGANWAVSGSCSQAEADLEAEVKPTVWKNRGLR